jgi:glycine betaine/proline transport system ATP-binding protein
MRLGDRIAMMRDGQIVQLGTAEEILNNPANEFVEQFVLDVDRTRVLTAGAVMVPPVAVVGSEQGPLSVHKLMREHQTSRLFVVDRSTQLMGAVDEEAVVAAVTAGAQTLDGIIDRDVVSVPQGAHLVDLLAVCANSPRALAVLDEDQRVVGVLARVTLLQALAQRKAKQRSAAQGSPTTEAKLDSALVTGGAR